MWDTMRQVSLNQTPILTASSSSFIIIMIGRRLSALSQDPRETSFLLQRLLVLIQRYNSVLILESFCLDEDPDL